MRMIVDRRDGVFGAAAGDSETDRTPSTLVGMTSPVLRALSVIALGGALLTSALAGCATTAGSSATPKSTAGPSLSDGTSAPQAAWLDATAFVLKTSGDACPPQIGDLIAGEQSLEIVLVDGPDEACAAVQTAHGTYIGLPAAFDSSRPVELTVTQAGGEKTELMLPGLADGQLIPADRMMAQTPAMALIDDDEIAVLTWGSSTCMPGSGTLKSLGGTEGSVQLHSHTDTICTMDLVPQITFVSAPDVQADAALTLEGYVDADGEPIVLTFVR